MSLKIKSSFTVLTVVLFLMVSTLAEARKIALTGEVNPAYKGKKFNHFAIATVNTVPKFRFQYERRMYDVLNDHFEGKSQVIEMSQYQTQSKFDPNVDKADSKKILQELRDKKVEVFIFFNFITRGGGNLHDVKTLEDAIEASVNHQHDATMVTRYLKTKVTLYDVATGKIIFLGQGPVHAKPHSEKWFKVSAKIQVKRLYTYMKKSGVIKPHYNDGLYDEEEEF